MLTRLSYLDLRSLGADFFLLLIRALLFTLDLLTLTEQESSTIHQGYEFKRVVL